MAFMMTSTIHDGDNVEDAFYDSGDMENLNSQFEESTTHMFPPHKKQ